MQEIFAKTGFTGKILGLQLHKSYFARILLALQENKLEKGTFMIIVRKTREVSVKSVDRPLQQRRVQYFIDCGQTRNW
mgnify:CR=1 FL=1